MKDNSLANEEKVLSQINERQDNTSVYDFLKSLDQKSVTPKVLEEAIKQDIRCILLVPGGMVIEGIPKLSKQEIDDIKLVADTIFMDQVFAGLPAERRTEAVSQAAVMADGLNLKHVPKDTLHDDFILNCLRMDGQLISAVDEDRRTHEMCMAAMQNNGMAIVYIQDEVTPEIALKAVQNNGQALEFVPKEMRTKEICRAALDNYPYFPLLENEVIHLVPFADVRMEHLEKIKNSNVDPLLVFGNINPRDMTKKMVELVVLDLDSGCFQFVPDRLKSQKLCINAVDADWLNIRFVPEKKKTKEVCDAALKHSFHALPYIPEKIKTNQYLMDIIKKDGHAIRYIAPEKLTHEICQEAIKTARSAYIVQSIPYPDVCLNLLRKCPDFDQVREFMMNIKPNVIDNEIAKELINRFPSLIKDLPDHVKDKQLYLHALELDAKTLRYIPDNYKTEELCRNACKRDGEAIIGLPKSLQKHDFYMGLVKENGINLKYIPREHREKDICQTALDNTFGIDHEKIHIISHIPHSDICLDVIKGNKNPDTIMEIMSNIDKGIINKDFVKEVVNIDARSIMLIPDAFKTNDICQAAVLSKPNVLGWVPENQRTPEICVYALKANPQLIKFVPADIAMGNNLYTFSKKLENEVQGTDKLTFDHVLKLYRNEVISVKGLHLGGQSSNEQSLQYLNDKVVIKGMGSIQEKQDTKQNVEKQESQKRGGLKLN